MAKTYTKDEIEHILMEHYNAVAVIQYEGEHEDEYHVLNCGGIHCEVVDYLTALKNEEDFAPDKNAFLWDVINDFIENKEIKKIGNYFKIADNLYCREY